MLLLQTVISKCEVIPKLNYARLVDYPHEIKTVFSKFPFNWLFVGEACDGNIHAFRISSTGFWLSDVGLNAG
jgi:hypothetical protein